MKVITLNNGYWYAYTPAGTICLATEAKTREQCIKNLLEDAAHMPYRGWEGFQNRGYTVEQLNIEWKDWKGKILTRKPYKKLNDN